MQACMKGSNSTFQPAEVIDFMIDALILGHTRFSHMEALRRDEAYACFKERPMPSEEVCRDLNERLAEEIPEETAEALRMINRDILLQMANLGSPRDVCLDIVDTVCTIYGNQEGAEVGHNPRYKGRALLKENLAVITDFIESCRPLLPEFWRMIIIHMDIGTYSYLVLT